MNLSESDLMAVTDITSGTAKKIRYEKVNVNKCGMIIEKVALGVIRNVI